MTRNTIFRKMMGKAKHLTRPIGFFTPYDYIDSLAPTVPEYAEFKACFEGHLGQMQSFADTIKAQDSHFEKSLASGAIVDWNTNWLAPLDCATIYSAVPHFKPAKIVEIGCGNSTYFMAQAILDHRFTTKMTCIDPAPRKSIENLSIEFARRILSADDLSITDKLEANDILFVDSSHLLQEGYDVDIIFNRLVPRLNKGVVIHVHDVFLPDPYPKNWRVRHYNEQSVLGGWLFSGALEPVFASCFVATRHPEMLAGVSKAVPRISTSGGGSLWLRKATAPFRG